MNSIDQALEVRKALVMMLKVYSKYEGKNLNRYKNKADIKSLHENFNNNPPPFSFNGLLSNVIINHTNINLSDLRVKIKDIEDMIISLDLFESSYLDEYKIIDQQIKGLVSRRLEIENKVKGVPRYMIQDLIK